MVIYLIWLFNYINKDLDSRKESPTHFTTFKRLYSWLWLIQNFLTEACVCVSLLPWGRDQPFRLSQGFNSFQPSWNQSGRLMRTPTWRDMKRSRARVTTEGQRILLQISLQIKIIDFLLNSQNHRMNHIFPGILLNPRKNIVKILETRPQSS